MRATDMEESHEIIMMSEPLEIKCDGAQGIDEAYNLRQNGKEHGTRFDAKRDACA
jgi:hypothetical protein